MGTLVKTAAASVAAAAAAGTAYFGPGLMLDHLRPWVGGDRFWPSSVLSATRQGGTEVPTPPPPPPPWICEHHAYTTRLVSLDPLLIYIESLVSSAEAAAIVDIGTPRLTPSPITGGSGYGSDRGGHQARTSWSAPLPVRGESEAETEERDGSAGSVVDCVLGRSRAFLGTLLAAGRDDMGSPQMVRYTAGQKFDAHRDWFAQPRIRPADAADGRRRLYNRVATLFLVLQANHTAGGETWFPHARPIARSKREKRAESESGDDAGPQFGQEWDRDDGGGDGEGRIWREHEDGGLAFRAIPGNALFWVNLHPNGTGDERVLHAGLPIADGVKTAMNIWPRAYFGPDA